MNLAVPLWTVALMLAPFLVRHFLIMRELGAARRELAHQRNATAVTQASVEFTRQILDGQGLTCDVITGWTTRSFPDGDAEPGEEIVCGARAVMRNEGVSLCLKCAHVYAVADLLTPVGARWLGEVEANRSLRHEGADH